MNYHFAKFYLCSHAFRGLQTNEEFGVSLSHDLEDIADCAVATAFAILQLLLESEELKVGLVGGPHYFHTMFAFAAVFLLKVSTRYTQHVNVDIELVLRTITQVADVFGSYPCARQHLVHRITRGLKEMLERSEAIHNMTNGLSSLQGVNAGASHDNQLEEQHRQESGNVNPAVSDALRALDLENFDFISSMPVSWPTDFDAM